MIRTPVLFVPGAWLRASSWECWVEHFANHGYPAHAPGWPGKPSDPGLDELTGHYAGIARAFEVPPVLIGHSVGGLVVQHLLGDGVGRAAVALAPAPINGVELLERECAPECTGSSVELSVARFHELLANTVGREEAELLHERYAVPAPRRLVEDVLRHRGTAVDTANPARGPLLLVSGQEDRLVPDRVTRAVYKQYGDSTAPTDLKQWADRGHSLTVDGGWRPVADHVLGWLTERGITPG
ncbi:alpha/beta hydrolase [Kitasatospora sp. NPDC004289]